jgi:hypothetical protein
MLKRATFLPPNPGAPRLPFRGQGPASEEARRYVSHFVGPFARVMDPGERKSPYRVSDL